MKYQIKSGTISCILIVPLQNKLFHFDENTRHVEYEWVTETAVEKITEIPLLDICIARLISQRIGFNKNKGRQREHKRTAS